MARTTPERASGAGRVLVARLLLIGVTALLIARPMVLGEDPGLTSDLSDTGSMVLTLFWFMAAAVAALLWAWRPAQENTRSFGVGSMLVGLGLLGTALIAFGSAEFDAPYRFPARLIAWEWFGLFAVFFTVRRVAVSQRAQRGLLTALLASAVSLSAHAVYQEFVELPRDRRQFSSIEKIQEGFARQGVYLSKDDPILMGLQKRVMDNHVYGTYAHPNSFAGCLALLLPGLVGAVLVCRQHGAGGRQTGLVLVCTLLVCVGLWLTHSRGALLGVAAAALIVLLTAGRHWLWAHRTLIAAAAVLIAAGGYALYASGLASRGLGKESGTLQLRLLYWRTTWQIIGAHPWLGVGPGNFAGAYAAQVDPNAAEQIKDPHNFALEVWATCGLFALLSLLVSLAAFFVVLGRSWHRDLTPDPEPPPDEKDGPPWEFYTAGIIGLLLGFVLRVSALDAGVLRSEVEAAALRSLVWFPAFWVLEGVLWSGRARALALLAGVIALLVNLCVSGGIAFPSVATLLWAAIALALNACRSGRADVPAGAPERALRIAAVPLLAGMAFVYLGLVFYPVSTAFALQQQAVHNGQRFQEQLGKKKGAILQRPIGFLKNHVVKPLEEAARLTPDDARAQARLTSWYGELWRLEMLRDREAVGPEQEFVKALAAASRAQRLDPEGIQGYMAEYQLRLSVGQEWERLAAMPANRDNADKLRELARKQYREAAAALERYQPHDPTDVITRYLRAEALSRAGDPRAAARVARETLQLDQSLTRPMRRLSQDQVRQLRKWEAAQSAG